MDEYKSHKLAASKYMQCKDNVIIAHILYYISFKKAVTWQQCINCKSLFQSKFLSYTWRDKENHEKSVSRQDLD